MSDFDTVAVLCGPSEPSTDCFRLVRLWAPPEKGHKLFGIHAIDALAPAVEDMLFPFACFGDEIDEFRAGLVKNATAHLAKKLRELLPAPASEHIRVAYGAPAAAWDELRGLLGPDLFACPTLENNEGLGRALPALAQAALSSPTTPVLLARRCQPEDTIAHIVVGVDLTPSSRFLLDAIIPVAARLGARITPVHVAPTADHLDHAGLTKSDGRPPKGSRDPRKSWPTITESLDLPFSVHEVLDDILAPLHVTVGDPAVDLLAAAVELQADLLVVGHSQPGRGPRTTPGRTAAHIIHNAPCHVACYPLPSLSLAE
jgi:nucleotide-binding universal stress UspA family protein